MKRLVRILNNRFEKFSEENVTMENEESRMREKKFIAISLTFNKRSRIREHDKG